ncbi:MAG: histidine--tRNA ligase [Pseudolabrys sp.]
MADKPNKANKLKARLPRGLADRGPAEIAATRGMVEKIRLQFERYGFEPVETPAIEYTDALGKFLPDQDRPNEGVFSFQDDDQQWLSLRYDLTAPLARYVAENFQNVGLPYRSYRHGYVYRNEKPGPGRYRQFMQFDADTVGSASMAADAEMCMLAADTMEALGIPRGQYRVKVSSRKVIDGILDDIGFGGEINAAKRLTTMRAIDKYDRLGPDGVESLLGKGRIDESGDHTTGADLERNQIDRILMLLNKNLDMSFASEQPARAKIDQWCPDKTGVAFVDNLKQAARLKSLSRNSIRGREGADELITFVEVCEAAGYGSQRILIDPSVVRGLEYYTGPVYEVELLIETKDDKGRPVRFGSVGGGGRYDGLVSRFRGEPVPATGFSIGVSRLQAALTLIGKLDAKPPAGPVLVTVFGAENVTQAQKLTAALRSASPPIRAEMYLGNHKHGIGQQLKYADKRKSPCAVIQGPDEKAANPPQVLIRDLIAGAAPSGTADRDAHLKKQAHAQVAVPEAKLVDAVRDVLKRHGIK